MGSNSGNFEAVKYCPYFFCYTGEIEFELMIKVCSINLRTRSTGLNLANLKSIHADAFHGWQFVNAVKSLVPL